MKDILHYLSLGMGIEFEQIGYNTYQITMTDLKRRGHNSPNYSQCMPAHHMNDKDISSVLSYLYIKLRGAPVSFT